MTDFDALCSFYRSLSTAILSKELSKIELERDRIHSKGAETLTWRQQRSLEKLMPRKMAIQEILEERGDDAVHTVR